MMLPLEIVHFGLEVTLTPIRIEFKLWTDIPLPITEWGLSTQFAATDEFLLKWADAQKDSYSKGAGWIVSAFKHSTHVWNKLS